MQHGRDMPCFVFCGRLGLQIIWHAVALSLPAHRLLHMFTVVLHFLVPFLLSITVRTIAITLSLVRRSDQWTLP